MKTLFVIALFSVFSSSIFAQDFEGEIVYKISYADITKEMQDSEKMLPTSQTFYIKHNKSRFEINTPLGATIVISNSKSKSSTVLIDGMGQKFKMTLTSDNAENLDSEIKENLKIVYLNEEKTIAGYTCKKALVTSDKTKDNITLYYTQELPLINLSSNQYTPIPSLDEIALKGMPLEYIIKTEDMNMTVTVQTIKKMPVADSMFTIPEGYTEIPASMKGIMDQH